MFVALLVAAAGVVALWLRGPKEPVYQGKKLTELIREGKEYNPDREQRDPARATIKATGTNALPYLLSEFTRPESRWSSSILQLARAFNLRRISYTPEEDRALLAAGGIYMLGSNAVSAIPILTGYLNERMRGDAAATALAGMGELTLPYLLNACASTNPLIAWNGTRGLMVMVRKTEAAIPPLIQLTLHTNFTIRFMAVTGLIQARSRLDLAIPALTNLLSDSDLRIQMKAAYVLSFFESAAKPAVPHLLFIMRGPDPKRASWASNALHLIAPSALPR